MVQESTKFLEDLLRTPSPSGFEQTIQSLIKKRVERFADDVEVDVHGNLMASVNPDGKVRVMLAGHCDQIGFMVTYIDDQGYLSIGSIGGIDASVVPGSRLKILAKSGVINGVIGHKPVHLVPLSERGNKVELKKLWVDIGAESGEEAKSLICIGDPAVFEPRFERLGKNKISAPGCDDRVGVFVIMEALRIIAQESRLKKSFPVAVFAVSTVQEEIGLRGARTAAFGIDPHVGIAVDVTHASDNPAVEAKEIGSVKLGQGPTIARGANINPVLEELLVSTAKKGKLPYQPLSSPGATPTDANALQVTRAGVATALIGIPNRYMHSQVEVVDMRDLECAAQLIAQTVMRLTAKMSFIPV